MGETTDLYGMWLCLLCILPKNVVRIWVGMIYRVCAGNAKLWVLRHGPHTDCPLSFSEEFIIKYTGLGEGAQERMMLQRRFGKGNLEKLVRRFEEDRANREWLDKSTMACPGCGVHTEKSAGCNHVCHFFPLVIPIGS